MTKISDRFQRQIQEAYPGAVIVTACPVGWTGWELDFEAALVTHKGRRLLLSTDHGGLCPIPKSFLVKKVAEYKAWIAEAEEVLALLK